MTLVIDKSKNCFTDDSITQVIWRYSLNTLTALGFTLPITISMTAVAIGTSIRCNNKVIKCACLKQSILKETIVTSLLTSTLVIICLAALAAFFSKDLLTLLGNNSWQVVPSTSEQSTLVQQQDNYLTVRFLGWAFLGLIWQCNAIFRALGKTHIAGSLMIGWLACKSILAILLLSPTSPLFQAGLDGVSIIHGTTDVIFAIISLLLLTKNLALTLPPLSAITASIRQPKIAATMVVIQQLITPISLAILTIIAANIDSTYVAAFAILFRVEAALLLLPMILTTSMPTIIGTNYWSGHNARVRKAYNLVFISIIAVQLLIAFIVFYYSDFLAKILCPQTGVLPLLKSYLIWVPWGYAGAGCAIVYQSCLNAKGKTVEATTIAIGHRILLLIPLTIIGSLISPSEGLFQGMLLGHIGVGLFVLMLFKYGNKKITDNPLQATNVAYNALQSTKRI